MKIATVCSGIGSPELAVENLSKELGFEYENVFACEIDKFARASYNAIHSCGTMYEDMTKEQWDGINQYADLFIGGIPCQAFSLAGKRLGEKDKRGVLFYDFYRYVKNQQPKVFIIENVKGLLSDNKGCTFKNWCSLLGQTVNYAHNFFKHPDCLDYHLHYTVLNTKDFGLPQNRERVFLIGIRPDITFEYEFPKGWPLIKRLKDVLENDVDEKYYLSGKAFDFITKPIRLEKKFTQVNGNVALTLTAKGQSNWTGDFIIDEGKINNSQDGRVFGINGISQCLSAGHNNSPKILIPEATVKGFSVAELGDTINLSNPSSKTRRGRVGKQLANTLDTACNQAVVEPNFIVGGLQQNQCPRYDGISPTLTSAMGMGGGQTPIHNYCNRIRRLTPLECWGLQGFPDGAFYKAQAVNSDTQLYKQAGNSISVPVIQAIIRNLLPILNK